LAQGHDGNTYAWPTITQGAEGIPPPPPGYQYVNLATAQEMIPITTDTAAQAATAAYLQAIKPGVALQPTLLTAAPGQYYSTEDFIAYQWAQVGVTRQVVINNRRSSRLQKPRYFSFLQLPW